MVRGNPAPTKTASLTRRALAAASSPLAVATCRKPAKIPVAARPGVHSMVSSSSSEQADFKCSTSSGVSTIDELRPSSARQAARASAPARSVRSDKPMNTPLFVTITSPPSACPDGSSSTLSNRRRRVGASARASPARLGAPGRSRIAPSVKTKAGSSTKSESGKASSAGSTMTSTPADRSAAV